MNISLFVVYFGIEKSYDYIVFLELVEERNFINVALDCVWVHLGHSDPDNLIGERRAKEQFN